MHARFLACLILALGTSACDYQTQSDGAHVHGHARLAIAMEESGVAEIEFESPAQSLYGFEQEPSTAEEQDAQVEALEALDLGIAGLLVAPGELNCRFETLSVEVSEEEHEGGDRHDDADSEEEEAGHESEDGASEDAAAEDHESETSGEHREIHARYRLTCDAPLAGETLKADFGSRFEGIEELIVTILGDAGQRSLELEAGRGEIDL